MNGEKMGLKIRIFAFELDTVRGPLILLITLFLTAASQSYAHEFYFCYAETEYNELSRKFETTIIATAHDIEKALSDYGSIILEDVDESSDEFNAIEIYLNDHYSIAGTTPETVFSLLGIEVDLNGTVHFYLESNEVDLQSTITFRFDLLMDQFSEQQNKMTFIRRDSSATIVFLHNQQEQEFDISKL